MKKIFSNLKIGTKILIGYLVVVIITLFIGGIGGFNLYSVNDTYSKEYKNSADALEFTERVSNSFQKIRSNLNGFLMANTQGKNYYKDRINEHKNVIDKNIADYKKMLSTNYQASEVVNELELIDAVQDGLIKFGEKRNQTIDAFSVNRGDGYDQIKNGSELYILATEVDNAITELINYNNEYAENQIVNLGAQATSSLIMMLLVMVIGIVIAILLGIVITRNITKPIKFLVNTADAMALGDVGVEINNPSKDEVGQLASSFKRMIESSREQAGVIGKIADGDLTVEFIPRSEKDLVGHDLQKLLSSLNYMIKEIAAASEQVSTGATQVSDSSMMLSQGTTEQASSIEELTASIEEIASQTKLNTQNANQANEIAEKTKQDAIQGNEQMNNMLKAMEDISESSNNIYKINKVIDDIAFQTNMLALNAAVEAARAGQHGKGFAVVAEEVKTLAARSADAAKETTEMIENSIRKSEGGSKIAKDTAEALSSIVVNVERVSNLVNDISVASNEQDIGISQINQGIMQVSEVVQNNSATSEESAAASEELSSQAEVLNDMVSKFKVKKDAKTNETSLGNLTPEVLKMLKELSEKRSKNLAKGWHAQNVNSDDENISISLSDKEFGKY